MYISSKFRPITPLFSQTKDANGGFPDKVSTNQGLLRSRYRFVIAGLLLLANLVLGLNLFAASPIVPLIIEDYGVRMPAR